MEQDNSPKAASGYDDDRNLFLFDSNHKSLKNINSVITGIKDNLPIISILILFCSLLKLNWYYRYFRINILNFINFSELISPILIDLSSIVISFLMMVLLVISFTWTNTKAGTLIKNCHHKKGYFLFKNTKFDLIPQIAFFLISFVIPIYIIFWSIVSMKEIVNLRYLVYLFMGWMISQILFILIHKIFKIKVHVLHFYLLFTLGTFVIGSVIEGWDTASAFYANKKLHTSSIIFEKDTLMGSSSRFLIGLTNEYALIWDDKNIRSEVRRRSDIKSILPGFLPIPSLAVIYFGNDSLNKQ